MQKAEIIHKLLPKRNGVNAALFLVEIFVALVYSSIKPESPLRDNLAWIPGILKSHIKGLPGDLGNELFQYLKDLVILISKNGTVATFEGHFISIKSNNILDVAYMCLDQLFSNNKIFYISDLTPYRDLLEQCQKFIDYSKFML
jgi:hypothetical protein